MNNSNYTFHGSFNCGDQNIKSEMFDKHRLQLKPSEF